MQTTPVETRKEEKDLKKKRREARRDLLALLKRLRKLCDQFDSAEEWLDFIEKKVFPLLVRHEQALGPATTQRLREAAKLTESTRTGVQQACRILRLEIGKIIPLLPLSMPLAMQVAAGLAIFAAAVVGVTVIAVNVLAVQIDLRNTGCETIRIPGQYNDIPGFTFPPEIPPDGQFYRLRVNPAIELDSSRPDTMTLLILGWRESVPLNNLSSMILDEEQELLGQMEPLRFSPGSQHTLSLICGE